MCLQCLWEGPGDRDRRPDPDRLAADAIGIVRGMTDMAGRTQETDSADLTSRIKRVVSGYLAGA